MTQFIQNLIGNDYIATSIMSLIPMIELKGGIVFARGVGFNFFVALALAYIGSTLAFLFVYWLVKPILNLLKKIKWFNTFALKIESYIQKKADDAVNKSENKAKAKSPKFIKQLAVFIFVAIPLPLTGVWMGTAVAVFLNLKFKDTILPVAIGNLVAGVIISLLAELFIAVWNIAVLDYVLYGLLGLALILLIVTIIKIARQKPIAEDGANENQDKVE